MNNFGPAFCCNKCGAKHAVPAEKRPPVTSVNDEDCPSCGAAPKDQEYKVSMMPRTPFLSSVQNSST